jgi:hypothetical protein
MVLTELANLAALGALGLGTMGACSCSNPQATQPQQTEVTNVTPANALLRRPSVKGRAREFAQTYSVASLRQDALDECVDFTIHVDLKGETAPEWTTKGAPELRAKLAKLGTELRKPCSEQFANRVVLATCVAISKRDGQELQLVERFYNPDTVGMDDLYMQECLRLGGTWEGLAQDSVEFRRAKADAKLRGLTALANDSG